MKSNTKLEDLRKALQERNCTIEKHSNVMEITFENEEDADWFEGIFEHYQRQLAVCCLMPLRGKKARPKFVFNVKDMDKFIELINSDTE